MKVVHKKEGAIQTADNTFTKVFKYGDIEMYVSKAVDEETDKHFIVASIKEIQDLNVQNVQYPFGFNTEKERDEAYESFDNKFATQYIDDVRKFIIEQQTKQNEEKPEQNN